MTRVTKTWLSRTSIAALAAISLLTASACTDGKKAKEQAIQALHKQSKLQSYTFAGHAALQLGDTFAISAANPLTAALVHSLTTSTLDWSGTAQVNPLRLEAKLAIQPKAGAPLPEMPIVINNNKLYMQIPLLNPKNEYMSLDLKGQSASIGQASQSFAKLGESLLQALDAKWFKKETAPASAGDVAWTTVTVNASNAKAISDALQSQLPEWAASLQADGLLTQAQADAWKANPNQKQVNLQQPGSIRVAVGQDGYVHELQTDLRYTLAENGQNSPLQTLQMNNSWGQINQSPSFQQEVPANAKPFDDILKGLKK